MLITAHTTPRLAAALVIVTTAMAGCGDDQPTYRAPASGEVGDTGVQHIHGLGIDPGDRSLYIATHSGLFRAAPGEQRATRVGERRQDTMGFTVVGAKRFLGSGHPDARDNLPPLLGLIRSDDAGKTWDSVSLLGEVDFHVLRSAGTRIYGVNATDGRLLVSDDGGRTWARRAPPNGVLDVIADPDSPDHLVAAAEDGLYASSDAGERWRPIHRGTTGLLSWPSGGTLHVVEAGGEVRASSDDGRTWRRVGAIGGQPAAFASDGDDLYVALHTNEVKVSEDGGRTWRLRVAP